MVFDLGGVLFDLGLPAEEDPTNGCSLSEPHLEACYGKFLLSELLKFKKFAKV